MMAEIEVIQPGLFSTIQDSGRFGFRNFGVPVSGPMDAYSSRLGNLILDNKPGSPVLEITLLGPMLKFNAPARIVITGAHMAAMINTREIKNNRICNVFAGDILIFGKRVKGARAYIAIQGGFICDQVLGSYSWYEGLTTHFRLEEGMKLKFDSGKSPKPMSTSAVSCRDDYLFTSRVPVYPGPEFHKLAPSLQKQLCNIVFSVDPASNRMAVQVKENLKNNLEPIITGPVIPGTVQWTPSGKLIVLMKDCQTSGGYPRVLQVSEDGINILAQKGPGDSFEFELLSLVNKEAPPVKP